MRYTNLRFTYLLTCSGSDNTRETALQIVRPCNGFYRAMHFSAKRGIAIAYRLSVRLRRWWIVIT